MSHDALCLREHLSPGNTGTNLSSGEALIPLTETEMSRAKVNNRHGRDTVKRADGERVTVFGRRGGRVR